MPNRIYSQHKLLFIAYFKCSSSYTINISDQPIRFNVTCARAFFVMLLQKSEHIVACNVGEKLREQENRHRNIRDCGGCEHRNFHCVDKTRYQNNACTIFI